MTNIINVRNSINISAAISKPVYKTWTSEKYNITAKKPENTEKPLPA